MTVLDHKIDFAVLFTAEKANPNGDPLNGNRPRQNYDGKGEVSDVCLKRKMRNRFQDMGERVFVQSSERSDDGFNSLKERAESIPEIKKILSNKKGSVEDFSRLACQNWLDVRAFGQVFAFSSNEISTGVRGPVAVHTAESVHPVMISSMQITKSVNSMPGDKKGSDTMGMKHRVDFGLYVMKGSINVQLAEKTGFTQQDAQKLKDALITLFENDSSSARPDGSMEVKKVYWWEHNSKLGQYSSAKVHRSLMVEGLTSEPQCFEDYKVTLKELEGLKVEVLDGI